MQWYLLYSFDVYSAVYFVIYCSHLIIYTLYVNLPRLWRQGSMESSAKPEIYYKKGSKFIEDIISKCSTLQNGYTPASLWGKNGHVQTTLFGTVGRTSLPELPQQRFSVMASDGSTLLYDVFEPEEEEGREGTGTCWGRDHEDRFPYTVFICPGINNSSETGYVQGFTGYCLEMGFRVIVFNHLGAIKTETLTAHRIFTYGGTGDIALVYEDVCQRYPHTSFMGVGFSLGGCILVRFLGEKKERRRRFVCAASLCQGYDPYMHMDYVYDWKQMRRLYSFQISKFHKKLIIRHQHRLFPKQESEHSEKAEEDPKQLPEELFNGFETEITHEGRNCNGCSLDRRKCLAPDMKAFLSSTTMVDLDEAYTRRVLGFDSVAEMYQWISCERLLYEIDDIPMLVVNTADDPCVVEGSYAIPKKFVENQPKSVFVLTQYGGHLGFYEGGVIPNRLTWLDRLLVEFSNACIASGQHPNPKYHLRESEV